MNMKNKHKIGIAAGVVSLSLVTAMGAGKLQFGNLFAETPVSSVPTVNFQAGDKIVLAGEEFVLLDPTSGQLLSLKNSSNGKVKFDQVSNELSTWEAIIKSTYDGSTLINNNASIPSYYEVGGCDAATCSFITNIGNGTEFWTSTKGANTDTQVAINAGGTGKAITVGPGGNVTSSFECSTGTKDSDYFINGAGDVTSTDPTTCTLVQIREQWITDKFGDNGQKAKFDNPNGNQTSTLDYCRALYLGTGSSDVNTLMAGVGGTWTDTLLSYPKGAMGPDILMNNGSKTMGVWGDPGTAAAVGSKVVLNHSGDECSLPPVASKAAVRPMITADLSSILFVSANGTPVNVDPQIQAVVLTLYDGNIDFTMTADQAKDIEANTGDVLKVNYTSATTGAGQNIKAIVVDKNGGADDGKIIRYLTLEDISSNASGELNIDTGSAGLDLSEGNYTLQLFNEQDNSGIDGKSNHASAFVEISLSLQQGLSLSDLTESGDLVPNSNDFYDEKGVKFSVSNSADQAIIDGGYNYVRIGTMDELNKSTTFTSANAIYTEDGVYEPVDVAADDDHPDGKDYSNCLYVQLATGPDSSDSTVKTTSMLRLDSVKIDSKIPYFPSSENGDGKPFTTENIKDDESEVSFFSAVFGNQPPEDLDEDFAGEHIKLIPNAKDYAASQYDASGALKQNATPLEGGIASYRFEGVPLNTDGTVNDNGTKLDITINTNDQKFKDENVDPYFELQGSDAYWIKLTAIDRAGREKTIEQKLYMDATEPGVPVLDAYTKDKDGKKTTYAGGILENDEGEEVANWSNEHIEIELSLTDDDLEDLKSGIDYFEYTTTSEIKAWVDAGKNEEDLPWTSLGKKKDASGKDTKDPETIFKTKDLNLDSVDDEYHFRAVSRADIKGQVKKFNIKVDTKVPEFEVEAIDVATKQVYQHTIGSAATKGIRFEITPKGTAPASGAKYYYRGVPSDWKPKAKANVTLPTDKEIPWIEIKKDETTGKYSFLAAQQFDGTYYFKCENGAGVATAVEDMFTLRAEVGVPQPKTPIKAEATLSDGSAYDNKWTNKDITITLSGGLDGQDTPAYYEYAYAADATSWTKVDAGTDGTFTITIDSTQTLNKNFYFRVIKNGDDDEIPYSTTKTGLRIRHDAVVPYFDTVELDPETPNIAASFVTLRVKTKEISSSEAKEASLIAYYSVDGGANWIAADAKNPFVFTYDFNENTSDITLMVKDEAGNETTYDEKALVVDNIDKTGPSAPKFDNSTEFEAGKWLNKAQDVKISFTPADTGAEEWIQYRIQKQDNGNYEEYDPATDTTGGQETWIDNKGVDSVSVTIDKEGTYRVIARTIDAMDRVSAESLTTDIIRLDMTAPTITDIKEVEDKWTTAATKFLNALTGNTYFKDHITYTFDGADNNGGSGLEKFQYQLAESTAVQPDDNEWIDAYKGEVNIEKDFVGKLYARSVDYAGNVSNVVEFDGISVDATTPILSVAPVEDPNWTNRDSITITATDEGSGIKDGEVVYTSTYSGNESFPNGTLELDTNGQAILSNLPNGEYDITFLAEDNSEHSISLTYHVKVDKDLPQVEINDRNPSNIVTEKEVLIEVQKTTSGIKDFKVTLDGKELDTTKTNYAAEKLTGDNVEVYSVKVKGNGKLEAEVISNTLVDGSNANAKTSINITNVYNVKPKLKLEAFIGKDETQDVYTSGAWTTDNVEIVLNNTESAFKTSDLVFQYQEWDINNQEVTNGWTNIDDTQTSTKTGRFSVYGNGQRTYKFRVVMPDPEDDTKEPILISDEKSIVICQDTQRPNAPSLIKTDPNDYAKTKWYVKSQTLEVDFTANMEGLGQWVEYIDDSESKPTWKKAKLNQTSNKYEITVKGDKEHVIRIRTNDEFKRASQEIIAYVNIDTSTPDFDVKKEYSNSNATITLITKDKSGNSTIGISGIYDATIQKKDTATGNLLPNTMKHFYGDSNKSVVISKDDFGNGTYEVELTTVSGKTITKEIEINGINLPKPVFSVKGYAIDPSGNESDYTSGTWVDADKIRLEVLLNDPNNAGNIIYQYQVDGDKDWTNFANDGADNTMEVTGSGRHNINIRAVNESNTASDVYHFSVWIDNDWDSAFTIKDESDYATVNTPWYNQTQIIESTFDKDEGCKTWIEYSEDGLTWTHNSRNTYEVSKTGEHKLFVRKNDEMGSGNSDTGRQIYVFIDKESIKNFMVRVDKDTYANWLSTITFGVYHKDVKNAVISGDFGISGEGKLYYQIVDDPKDYVNKYAADANDTGWHEYSAPVTLDNNFKGFIYAKAKDKAGNMTNIIRTDGIVVDTVAPTIEIQNNDGKWMKENDITVNVSDFADATNSVVGNASGIEKITYETNEPTPVEGEIEVEGNMVKISDLRDGEYDLTVIGMDKAGNETTETKTIKLDRSKPTLTIDGYKELSFTSVNNLILKPNVGASGIESLKMEAILSDGTTIDEIELTGPNYTYAATKNGTYIFTLKNNAGVSVSEKIEVRNITGDMDSIMGLDIKTKNLDGDEIDYQNAEELANDPAQPSWTANDVVFKAHGSTKFKASVDGGYYTDFAADSTFTVSKEGVHTIKIKNDIDETVRTFIVKIDKYQVKDVAIQNSENYTDDVWYNKEQVIHATYTHDDTGIDEWVEYWDASEQQWKRGDHVVLNLDGKHEVRYRGNDELNRPTDEITVNVNIDQTAPTDLQIKIEKNSLEDFANHLFPNIFDADVKVTIHANSDISGNRKIEYQLVNEETGESYNERVGWKTYTNSFTIPDGFKGKVYARAYDNAGNKTLTVVTEEGVIVDTNKPMITFQTTPMTTWQSDNTVKATIDPTLSGLQSAYYTITKNGIVTKYDIDLHDIDANHNIILKDLPNGEYVIKMYARSKAGKTGEAELNKVMFENRAPLLSVDADLEKKATSITANVDVDMGDLKTTLTSLTWQSQDNSPQDIMTTKKFEINNNGIYKIVATTSSGVTAEKTLVVTNITNVSTTLGIHAYYSKDPTTAYLGGKTWSDQDITIEVRDTSGKIPTGDLNVQMRVIDLKDDSVKTEWIDVEADKNDPDLFKTVATDEGSFAYEFRGEYEGIIGSSRVIQVNIDRSAPKTPVFSEDTLKKYDNDTWHSEYEGKVEASLVPTDGCDEWLEYNIDGATDFDGNPLWLPTLQPTSDTIKVVDDKDHIVLIRTKDRLDRTSEANEIHVKMDNTRPTEFYIKAGENQYKDYLDILTGGIFYQNSQTIEIGGNFKISGVDKIEYQLVKPDETFDKDGTWTKVNIAKGNEYGTFQLLPGTKGVIYARGIDKAGNETGIIRSDLITIDNNAPLLKVPNDATDWGEATSFNIGVKDEQSGIAKVEYELVDINKVEVIKQGGEIELSDTVDADGYREGTIKNLIDGKYFVRVIATDAAGTTQTKYVRVMIDTVKPDLKVEGQTSKAQSKTTLDMIPVVGGSGLQEIQELKKNDDGTYTVIDTILPNADGSETYPRDFIDNGTYYFKVINNAGKESDIVDIVISNIKSDAPVIIFRTDNGYDPKTWSGKPVVLETSTNTNAKLSYRKKGDNVFVDADHGYYQDLTFEKTGTYTYEFKAVYEGVNGAADIETTEEYTVKVDLEAPKKPTIQDINDYSQWFKTSKDVTLIRDTSDYINSDGSTTKYGDGSKEAVYYHIEGDNDAQGNPNWIAATSDTVKIDKIGDNIVTFKIVDEVSDHVTYSDPIHVKIYADDPTITLIDTTKPVKTFDLGISIGGAIDADDQVKTLTVERVGSDTVEIQPEQGVREYNYPISHNGTYIVRVTMENGGSAEETTVVKNIIEEDPILDVTATYDDASTWKDYTFGKWATGDVKLKATDPKNTANMTIEVRYKVNGVWGNWSTYNAGDDIDIDTTGSYIYQFKTILTDGSDTYETIMDETYAVKVDKEAPAEVKIDQYDTYKDPNNWTSTSVNLTTSFTPDTVGAKEWVEYSLDNGTTWIKKNSVLISTEGQHKIMFRSADEAGRTTVAQNGEDTVYVNIDRSSAGKVTMEIGNDAIISSNPNNITFDKYYQLSDTITLTMMKDDTNVDPNGKIYYQFADGHDSYDPTQSAWTLYTGPISLAQDFKGSIYAYGENQSGKKTEIVRSNGITVDSEAPTIVTPSQDMSDWNKSNKYKVEITDNLSGLDPTTVKYARYADAAKTNQLEAEQLINMIDGKGTITLPDGEYYVEIKASDKAGNAATPVIYKVMINADQCNFSLTQTDAGDHAVITAMVQNPPISGIQGIYIRSNGSSWALMDTNSPATFDAYKNGVYEVKVVNGAGKDSAIQSITVNNVINDLPDFDLVTTDGFEFGDYWYQPLTILVVSDNADAIYYSTSGKDGPWKNYNDKIYINETSAYQFTFKVVKGDKEYISLPYDTRVICKQADGPSTFDVEQNYRTFMRSVFQSFSARADDEKWLNTGSRITFPLSSSTAPGLKAGTFVQILQADSNGNGIGYEDTNFTLVDEDDPTYIFQNEGHYVVYQFYAYYVEGEEDNWSSPAEIVKKTYNIDGTEPDRLDLVADINGTSTILSDLTGGLFFKDAITIIPQGSDSLSGIDHYEYQNVSCKGEACDSASPSKDGWQEADKISVPKDFEGIVYVKAFDRAVPANTLQRSIKLAIRDDITTYKILEDIDDWTNIKDLNIEVSPSSTGVQEVNYKVFQDEENEEMINIPAVDTENKLYTIHDIPEGIYNLKVIPVEIGGVKVTGGTHKLQIDRTKPIVNIDLKQDQTRNLLRALTFDKYYKPGLSVSANASDKAGALDMDEEQLRIEYQMNGGEWKEYTKPISFSQDEVVDIAFRAVDLAGNISDVVNLNGLTIDGSGPQINGASNNTSYWLPRTIKVTDAGSGVEKVSANDKEVTPTVLIKDKGLTKIEANDRAGNESSLAFTIKGLDDIKDEDINNDLIDEIEREFEEQKPGYDSELADEIQDKIDDLKNRNQDQSKDPNDGQNGDKDPSNDGQNNPANKPGDSDDGKGNGSGTTGDDANNPNDANDSNVNGSGANGSGTSNKGSGTSGTGTGTITSSQGTTGTTGTTVRTSTGAVRTGDSSNTIDLIILLTLSGMLLGVLVLKKKLNAK